MLLTSLNERTERQVQLSVYFDQMFKSLTKQDWDTKKIDKAIRSIETCNKKIHDYKHSTDLKKGLAILGDKEYFSKLIPQCLGYATLTTALGLVLGPGAQSAGFIASSIAMNMPTTDDKGKMAPKLINDLEKENNKALEWLKKEKERIEKGTAKKKKLGDIILGKQEGCSIFESVELI